jgi:hypothetical protein
MMTPEEFFAEALPWAKMAYEATWVLPSVVLAQWADETAFGGSDWSPRNNPGNVGDGSYGGQVVFPTLAAGVNAYIHTMLEPAYTAVGHASTPFLQCWALGASPWAAGHYGTPSGSDLWSIIQEYYLQQYDLPPPAPKPEGTKNMIAPTPSGAGYWTCSATGAVESFGDAQYQGGPNTSKTATGWNGPPNLVAGHNIIGFAASPVGSGYWCEDNFGLIYAYGAAGWHGNATTP